MLLDDLPGDHLRPKGRYAPARRLKMGQVLIKAGERRLYRRGLTRTQRQRARGGDGFDIFEVRDGHRELIYCGPGSNDVVLADWEPADEIAGDCERVEWGQQQ